MELVTADTGGNPAGTKTKAQELIERDEVDMIFGPLAAFELLAISDYVAAHKTPILSLAAAEDMTQRKPNPYFVRASGTSAQNMHPLADYARKELKYNTAITIAEDFAFGYEQMGGFQRVFDDEGGRVVKKLWPPIVTPDYTPYLAQLTGVDVIVQGFAGSNPLRFMKQYHDAGLKLPVLGGGPAGDDALMKSFGDEALGMISSSNYTSDLDSPSNKAFVAGMVKRNRLHPRPVRRRHVHQRFGGRGGGEGAGRQDRRQGGADQGDARGVAGGFATRAVPLRSFRQRGRQRLYPPRGEGQTASWRSIP